MGKTLYEGFENFDGSELSMFPSTHTSDQKEAILGDGIWTLVWTCEAQTWEKALAEWKLFLDKR